MDVPEIDIEALESQWSAGAFLLDVREADEFEAARISGAVPIPLSDVPARTREVPTDRTVYVVCARGGRSLRAAEFLRANGIDAVNVAGGVMAWQDSGRPTESGPATG